MTYVGKILYVELPNTKSPRLRWIVRKREDGRYIIRTPKIGVLLRDLDKKRDSDYGKETLMPLSAKIVERGTSGSKRRSGSKRSGSKKRRSHKKKSSKKSSKKRNR